MILIGNKVRFYNVKSENKFFEGEVIDRRPDGIPSCKMPMVKITGYPGYVLESHCKTLISPSGKIVESRKWGN